MSFRILGINGGIREGSPADRALRFTLEALERSGAQCETFDIGCLPILDGRPDDRYSPTVATWRATVEASDALVVAVPSYHGALPGGLKNALDFIDIPHAGGKPFALIGIAAGDAEPGVNDVTRVLRYIGAVAAVPDVVISRSSDHWGPGLTPSNAGVVLAVEKVAADLLAVCELRAAGKLPVP